MGGTNANDVMIANNQNQTVVTTTHDTNAADIQISYNNAYYQSNAVIESAKIDGETRIKESENTLSAVKYQADIDLEIAKLEFESEMAKTEVAADKVAVDMRNADANYLSAEAENTKADAKVIEAENKYSNDYIYDFDNYASL